MLTGLCVCRSTFEDDCQSDRSGPSMPRKSFAQKREGRDSKRAKGQRQKAPHGKLCKIKQPHPCQRPMHHTGSGLCFPHLQVYNRVHGKLQSIQCKMNSELIREWIDENPDMMDGDHYIRDVVDPKLPGIVRVRPSTQFWHAKRPLNSA